MDYKEFFNRALSEAFEKYTFSDADEMMKSIRERAEKMSNKKDNTRQIKFTEITPEHAEPGKPRRIFKAAACAAGAAAVLVGAVFGLNWLNEHGGLKEGGIESGSNAAYSANTYYAKPEPALNVIDISDLAGKTLQFSDFTAEITSASYDGSYMRVDYEGTCEESHNRNTLIFEPQSSGYSNGLYENMAIFSRGNGIDDNTEKYTIIKSFVLASDESMELVPAYYPDRRPIERINDITVSLKNENRRLIEQYIESEDMEISDGLDLPMLHISPNMLEIDPKTDDCAMLNEKPVVTALRKDGTQVELLGVTVSTSPSYFGADHYGYSGQYFYITPDPDDGDLTEMKAFIVNGKMYEITAEPMPAATTMILENGEIAEYVITSTTAIEKAPEESESDTTAEYYDPDAERSSYISIDYSRADVSGKYEFLYYIDDELQQELTETRELSGTDEFRWDVTGSGTHTYMVLLRNPETRYYEILFDVSIDFTKREPEKTFTIALDPKIFKNVAEKQVGDLSQIEGIYAPGENPYFEIGAVEAAVTENSPEETFTLPEVIRDRSDFYGKYLETPLTGDEAWELVKELGGIDFDFPLPYDKNLFVFDGCEFYINWADCDVTAFVGGTVEFAGWYYGWGNSVLLHDDNGHYWFWGHLAKELNVAEGDTVEAGAKIGHTGSSGITHCQSYAMRVG